MPAKDRYHDTVVRALQKDGWTILGEQVDLFVPSRRLWVDIRATKEVHTAIILEVKGFDTGASPVAYLSDAVGQCIVYKGALAYLGLSTCSTWRSRPRPFGGFWAKRSGGVPSNKHR